MQIVRSSPSALADTTTLRTGGRRWASASGRVVQWPVASTTTSGSCSSQGISAGSLSL